MRPAKQLQVNEGALMSLGTILLIVLILILIVVLGWPVGRGVMKRIIDSFWD